MTKKRFSTLHSYLGMYTIFDDKEGKPLGSREVIELLDENEQLKEDLKRCRAWINSDKYDYELTLAFIKNKGYSLKDVLEYEKELKMNKRFINDIDNGKLIDTKGELSTIHYSDSVDFYELWEFLNKLNDENEELKKGMIGVVDRYIKNVDCNPPSSARTYMKIKGALVNIREDLRDLIGDFE